MDVIKFPEKLQTTSDLSILLHGIISLPDGKADDTTCCRQFRRPYSAQNNILCQLQVLSSCSVDQIIN